MNTLRTTTRGAAALAILTFGHAAWAHAPVLDCYAERDKVKCEAGFSDGSSAAGRKILVRGPDGKLLQEGQLDQNNAFVFQPPSGDYSVVFVGGDGHDATLPSADIAK